MTQASIRLKRGEGRVFKAGGPWIYDNEISEILGDPADGDVVAIEDYNGYPLGVGFLNRASTIAVRALSRKPGTVIDEAFLEGRVRAAWQYRKDTVDTSSCRIIFGEADFLPGLVVDKFSDVLVVESLALGIDRLKSTILRLLVEILEEDGVFIRGIYERSDAKVRLKEGMERVSAEAAPARAPRPAGSPHRRPLISGTSLAELLATGSSRTAEPAAAEETAATTEITVDPECGSKLERGREGILGLIRERRPRFVPAFEQMQFRGHTIAVSVPTAELREEILRTKTAMLTRIAELAGISGALELEVTVNEEIRAARPIKLEDRVKYMTDKNPLLAEFRKALDLEVE